MSFAARNRATCNCLPLLILYVNHKGKNFLVERAIDNVRDGVACSYREKGGYTASVGHGFETRFENLQSLIADGSNQHTTRRTCTKISILVIYPFTITFTPSWAETLMCKVTGLWRTNFRNTSARARLYSNRGIILHFL